MTNVEEYLQALGMDSKMKGYGYCCAAVEIIASRELFIKLEVVYFLVARKYATKEWSVERNVRYAIEKTWEKGDIQKILDVFGYTVDKERGKPTNREFLFMLADKIRSVGE